MATRYWVGGGSSTNANATGNTNWASSSGGANNASVPTTGDVVIFDANSGSGICVWNFAVSLARFDAQDFAGTITHNSSITITITGAAADTLRLPLSGAYNPIASNSLFTLTATSGTTDITSNGKRFAALTLNGSGGTFRLLDALRVDLFTSTSTLTLTAGTFNANNQNVTVSAFSSSNSNTRTITMGSGTWTLGGVTTGGSTIWNTGTTTNLTFNKNTANIVIPSNALAGARTFATGSLTFNGLTIDSNSSKGVVSFTGAPAFSSLSVGAGMSIELVSSATFTVSGSITLSGTQSLPIGISATTAGAAATLSCPSGSVDLTWGAVRDIAATGGATFTATNVFDMGNNTGWGFTGPTDYALTPAAIADAVWDELLSGHVADGSAGEFLGRVPGTQDGKTLAETILLMASALLGKASGLGTTTATFRSLDDAHDRIVATVDASGNRSAVTLDASSP